MSFNVGEYWFFRKSMNPVVLCERSHNPGEWVVKRIHGASQGKEMIVPERSLISIDKMINRIDFSEGNEADEHALEVLAIVKKYKWPVYIDLDAGDQIAEPGVVSVTVVQSGYWLNTFESEDLAKAFCHDNGLNLE